MKKKPLRQRSTEIGTVQKFIPNCNCYALAVWDCCQLLPRLLLKELIGLYSNENGSVEYISKTFKSSKKSKMKLRR